jgi:small-conductance mechanosensitive channel
MTRKLIILLGSLLASFAFSFLLHGSLTLANWLDAVFLVGLLLIMAAAVLVLIEAEFFNAFIKSFKNFFSRVNSKEKYIRESERRTAEAAGYRKEFPIRKELLFIGIFLCLASLILSSAFYYFLS